MLNPNKKYKYGQLVTINHNVYRVTKIDITHSSCCGACDLTKQLHKCGSEKCIGLSKCFAIFPREACLKQL